MYRNNITPRSEFFAEHANICFSQLLARRRATEVVSTLLLSCLIEYHRIDKLQLKI